MIFRPEWGGLCGIRTDFRTRKTIAFRGSQVLNFMRKNEKARNAIIVLVVLALASYVLVSFGEAPPVAQSDTIAKLGSTKIKLRDALIQQENVRGSYGQLDSNFRNQFTATGLITNALLLDSADQLGMTVSDQELRDLVIDVRTRPDGSFLDENLWSTNIKRIYRVQVESYEEYLREHSIKTDKFRRLFLDSTYIPEEKIKERFSEQNQKAKLEMVVLSAFDVKSEIKLDDDEAIKKVMEEFPEDFKTGPLRKIKYVTFNFLKHRDAMEISDSEVEEYYNANPQRYRVAERVKANHVLIKTDSRTEAEALALAEKVKTEIDEGLAFAEAAKKYSEDASNKDRGGSLGLFPKGRMVPEFEQVAFAMDVDEISAPIKTQFGFHIIQKLGHEQETVRTLEEAKSSIVNNLKRSKARDIAKGEAEAFLEKVNGGTEFAVAAQQAELKVEESSFFDADRRSNLGPTLGQNFQVRRAVFALEELNDVTEVLFTGNDALVGQWVESSDSRQLDLTQQKGRIQEIAEEKMAGKFIEAALASLRSAAEKEPEKSFKDLKGDRAYLKDNHFKDTDWIDGSTLPFELDRNQVDFVKEIYSLNPGDFLPESATKGSGNRYVLARLKDKQAPDMENYEKVRDDLLLEIRSELGGELLSSYLYAKLKEYDPNDQVRNKITATLNR